MKLALIRLYRTTCGVQGDLAHSALFRSSSFGGGQTSDSILVPPDISQDQFEKLWAEGQERLKNLSSNSEIIVATKSGHMINFDQPELVIDATKRVVTAVRDSVPIAHVR